jgi:hypothetical protein
MFKKVRKQTLQDLITCNQNVTDPIEKFYTEMEIVNHPVKLHTFIKRKNDYLFIKKIAPSINPPFMVDGYSVSIQQFRHYILCEILGDDY